MKKATQKTTINLLEQEQQTQSWALSFILQSRISNPEKEIKTLSGCTYADPTAAAARTYSMAVDGKNYLFFGTGVLFNANDTKRTGMSVYGLIDNGQAISSTASLVQQTANVGGSAGSSLGGDSDKMNSVGEIKDSNGLNTGATIYNTLKIK